MTYKYYGTRLRSQIRRNDSVSTFQADPDFFSWRLLESNALEMVLQQASIGKDAVVYDSFVARSAGEPILFSTSVIARNLSQKFCSLVESMVTVN